MRIPMVEVETLDPELKTMLAKWKADGGEPSFIRAFGHLPESLRRFVLGLAYGGGDTPAAGRPAGRDGTST